MCKLSSADLIYLIDIITKTEVNLELKLENKNLRNLCETPEKLEKELEKLEKMKDKLYVALRAV